MRPVLNCCCSAQSDFNLAHPITSWMISAETVRNAVDPEMHAVKRFCGFCGCSHSLFRFAGRFSARCRLHASHFTYAKRSCDVIEFRARGFPVLSDWYDDSTEYRAQVSWLHTCKQVCNAHIFGSQVRNIYVCNMLSTTRAAHCRF